MYHENVYSGATIINFLLQNILKKNSDGYLRIVCMKSGTKIIRYFTFSDYYHFGVSEVTS